MPDVAHGRAPRWAIALIGLALAGFIAVGVINFLSFNGEAKLRSAPWVAGNANLEDGVVIDARVLKVDTSLNEITFRLNYEPIGPYADRTGLLARPVTVDVSATSGTVSKRFDAGQEMRSQDVTESLYDGFQSDYPFDRYKAGLSVLLRNDSDQAVPTALNVLAEVHGFSFSLRTSTRESDGGYLVGLQVRRSGATRLFAIFVMVMMWLLAITAVGLMVRTILLGRAIEFPMFTFLAAMLFAFPALRNAMPGAPPLGARSDYLSFFWCEILLAFSLLVGGLVLLPGAIRGGSEAWSGRGSRAHLVARVDHERSERAPYDWREAATQS